MIKYEDDVIRVTIHDFKTNFSKYLRLLEHKSYTTLFVYKNKRRVGVFLHSNRVDRDHRDFEAWEE